MFISRYERPGWAHPLLGGRVRNQVIDSGVFFVRFWVRYDEDVDHKVGAKLLRFGFGGKDEQFWGLQNEMGRRPC